jgi:hypothetical protein
MMKAESFGQLREYPTERHVASRWISQRQLIFSVCIAWAVCSLAPIWKYMSHPKAAAATAIGVLFIVLGMHWLDRLRRRSRQISLTWFLLLFLALTTVFAVFYPVSQKHTLNSGSDREDALRIGLTAICHHQYPYSARTFLGNSPTPLPGALLLAAPFFALGHIAWQNFLWLVLFFCFTIHFFRHRVTALFFLVLFLLLSPSNLSDFASGGDYITNFFYLAIAIALFVRSLGGSLYLCIPAAAFLGLALSSRSIYVVILIPLLALTVRQITPFRTVVLFGVVITTVAVITLPVFMPHPITNLLQQINENTDKLRYIPNKLHPQWTLPVLGLIVVCNSFFVRMDLPRLYLLFSVSSFVMLVPPIVTLAVHMRKLPYECSYLSISILPFCLWALSQFEGISPTVHKPLIQNSSFSGA